MVKRILLTCSHIIAHSSRFICRYSVWVLRRRSVWGKRATPRQQPLSLSVDLSVWVTGGGSVTLDRRGGQEIQFSLVSTLLSWVIISQVGIENPKVLINLQISRGSGVLALGISVAPATDAADMARSRFVGSFFDAMCKFVAEAGSTDFFMIDGDVNGLWKAAPAQLFTRILLDALSPDMFRHACTSTLIVNDEVYSRPMQLFLMVEREAEAWPRTYHLLTAVQGSMPKIHFGYSHSGSRRYQQSSSVSNGSHLCPSKRTGVNQNCAGYTGQTIQRQISQGVRKVGGTHFSFEHNYIYPASARRAFSGTVVTPEGRIESQDVRQHPHLRYDDTAGRFGGSVSSYGLPGR